MPAGGQTRPYLILSLIAALWGSYPVFAKVALAHFPPYVLVVLRTSLASVFLAMLLFRRGFDEFRVLSWGDLRTFALLGFTGIFVSTGGTYLGIAFTTASSAALLQAASPVMVAIGARLYLKERLRRRQWAGVSLSALGVVLVVTRGSWRAIVNLELLPGDFIILVGQAGWAVYTVYGKRVLAVHSPAVTTTAAYVLGSLMLLPVPFVTARFFPAPDWASPTAWGVVAIQGILGAIAHVWWYEGVHRVGASRAAIFMNLQPVVGVVLAWILLGETIEPAEIVGGLAVLAGVGLTTRAGQRAVAAARPAP
jgi:drug/metabolite transporter (DMT)-like permease